MWGTVRATDLPSASLVSRQLSGDENGAGIEVGLCARVLGKGGGAEEKASSSLSVLLYSDSLFLVFYNEARIAFCLMG